MPARDRGRRLTPSNAVAPVAAPRGTRLEVR